MPWPHKRGIPVAATTTPAFTGSITLPGFGKVGKLLAGVRVKDGRADRNLQHKIFARAPVAIRALAVPSTLCTKFAIVAVTQERIVVGICFEIKVATVAAVATRRTA